MTTLYRCDSMAGMTGEIPGYVIVSRPKAGTPYLVLAATGQPAPEHATTMQADGTTVPLTAGPSVVLADGDWTWGQFKARQPTLAALCIPWGFGPDDPTIQDVVPGDPGFYQEPVTPTPTAAMP